MGDFLKYRFPNQPIHESVGFFEEITSDFPEDAFVISDFKGEKWYAFHPDKSEEIVHHSTLQPFVITEENYLSTATEIVTELNTTSLEKVVYSRIKKAHLKTTDYKQLFDELCERYPSTLVYLISSSKFGTWLGATPEQLIVVESGIGFTTALAGTKKSTDDSDWENKEKVEQAIVTSYIIEQLKALSINSTSIEGPTEFIAGPVKHLRTVLHFPIGATQPISIAQNLHPTPAVSGYPKSAATSYLTKIETHDRSLYTGVIGYSSKNQTQLYVNLRCCQLQNDTAYIYLGGGFTKDSIPLKEWDETENKSKTLLNILQNP